MSSPIGRRAGERMQLQLRLRAELARREEYRRDLRADLLPWVMHWVPDYRAGAFHRYVCAKLMKFLQDVLDKKRPRLMLFVPPAHGKTEMSTRGFPSWTMGKYPHLRILAATYNQTLADEFGGEVLRRVTDPEFARIFPKAAGGLIRKTTNMITSRFTGTYNALGIMAAGGGRHADIMIIDDPIKTRADAESPTIRRKIYEWYSGTARNRLRKGAGVLIIQTRWHVADLSGELLKLAMDDEEADQFEVIEFPATAIEEDVLGRMPGDPLCPELYDLRELRALQHSTLPRDWEALFQQRPYIEGGNLIREEWFNDVPLALQPRGLAIYQAWDLAETDDSVDYGDKSACFTVGRDASGQFWILDIFVCKQQTTAVADEVIRNYRKWRPQMVWLEGNGPGVALASVLDERLGLLEMSMPWQKVSVTHLGDKVARSLAFRDCLRLGMVNVDKDAPWWKAFIEEATLFPSQDGSPNQVDAASLLFLRLQRMQDGEEEETMQRTGPQIYTGRDALRAKLMGKKGWTNQW